MASIRPDRYLRIRSARSPSFGSDGRLAVIATESGSPQLWCLSSPQTWPTQLTTDGRVTFADCSPERPEVIFGKDAGGNERVQFYRCSLSGGPVVPLTDQPDAKHWWGGWSHDGSRFAFTSNRDHPQRFDVYVQERDATEATRIHRGAGNLTAVGWGPDDKRIALSEAHSNVEEDLWILNVETESLHPVTSQTADEKVGYESVTWGPEGEALYVVTDAGEDVRYLGRLDLESPGIEPVVGPGRWPITGFILDQESRRLAFRRNVDGRSDLQTGVLTDPTTVSRFPNPDLPDGVVKRASFDPAAERLAVGLSGRTVTENVYVITVEDGQSQRWTDASTAGIPRDQFVSPEIVRYESFDGLEVPALLSIPPDDDGPHPVIVDIHGGPESQRRPTFDPTIPIYLNAGYALFEPNVRGSTGYGREYEQLDDGRRRTDAIRDVLASVRYLESHPSLDASRAVVKGVSYGGFLALAAVAESPELWQGAIEIAGIVDLVAFLEEMGEWRREVREREYGSLSEQRAFLESISPLSNADQIDVPLCLIHGDSDPRVPLSVVHELKEEVETETVLRIYENEGHSLTNADNRVDAQSCILSFLDEHV